MPTGALGSGTEREGDGLLTRIQQSPARGLSAALEEPGSLSEVGVATEGIPGQGRGGGSSGWGQGS